MQRWFRVLAAAIVMIGAPACAGKVHHDSKPGYDFAAAKTYAWVTEDLELIQLGDPQPNVRTVENEKRIRAAIERSLEARGLTKVAHDDADLHVAFSVGTVVRYRLEGGRDSWIAGLAPGEKQTKGTLHIYVLDRDHEQEVWQGRVSKWLSRSDDPDRVVGEAVDRIMASYPVAPR